MSSTSFDDALALFDGLSPTDQLRFNFEVASRLKKGGKTGKSKSKTSSSSEAAGEKPKRKAAPGTLAWMAFVKHCKTTMADRFEGCTKEPERLTICKAIRAEDSAAYDAFTKDFVDNYSDAEAEEVVAAAAPAPAAPTATPAKAAKAPAKAAKATVSATASAAAAAPATPAKTTKAKTPSAPTKAAKAKTAPAAAMPQIEVDGETYFHDRSNNGLYNLMEDGSLGAWVGFYQPTDEEEPIRYTESPTDE